MENGIKKLRGLFSSTSCSRFVQKPTLQSKKKRPRITIDVSTFTPWNVRIFWTIPNNRNFKRNAYIFYTVLVILSHSFIYFKLQSENMMKK